MNQNHGLTPLGFRFSSFKVPGQNSWTEPSSESVVNHCKDFIPQQREKRRRMDDEAIDHMNMLVSSVPVIISCISSFH